MRRTVMESQKRLMLAHVHALMEHLERVREAEGPTPFVATCEKLARELETRIREALKR